MRNQDLIAELVRLLGTLEAPDNNVRSLRDLHAFLEANASLFPPGWVDGPPATPAPLLTPPPLPPPPLPTDGGSLHNALSNPAGSPTAPPLLHHPSDSSSTSTSSSLLESQSRLSALKRMPTERFRQVAIGVRQEKAVAARMLARRSSAVLTKTTTSGVNAANITTTSSTAALLARRNEDEDDDSQSQESQTSARMPAPRGRSMYTSNASLVKLDVNVRCAKDLLITDIGSLGDPFVELRLGPVTKRTTTKDNTCTPEWNEKFEFDLEEIDLDEDPVMQVTVFDVDIVGYELMGSTLLELTDDLQASLKQTRFLQWLPLVLEGKPAGQILLEITGTFQSSSAPPAATNHATTKVLLTENQTREDKLLSDRNKRRRYWDTLLLVVLMWNTFMIPFRFGFNTWPAFWALVLDYLVDAVYYINIYMKFTLPYETDGVWVVDLRATALHYLRSNFLLDLAGCFPSQLIAAAALGNINQQRNPLYRLNRMLNMYYTPSYLVQFFEAYLSWVNPAVVRIIKLVVPLFYALHYVACLLMLIVRYEGADKWLYDGLLSMPLGFQYTFCFYWSATATMGYSSMWPNSDLEFGLGVCATVSGVVVLAVLFAYVASLIGSMDLALQEFRNKLDQISDVLQYKKIPQAVQQEVMEYYKNLWRTTRGAENVEFLEELPDQLQHRLMVALNSEIVRKVPLFATAVAHDDGFLTEIVLALEQYVVVPNTDVCKRGTIGTEMYFIAKGELAVMSETDTILAILKDGNFFGELSLLFEQPRTATIRANCFCTLYRLKKEAFDSIMLRHPQTLDDMMLIAQERLNLLKRPSIAPTLVRERGSQAWNGPESERTTEEPTLPPEPHSPAILEDTISTSASLGRIEKVPEPERLEPIDNAEDEVLSLDSD